MTEKEKLALKQIRAILLENDIDISAGDSFLGSYDGMREACIDITIGDAHNGTIYETTESLIDWIDLMV